MKVFFRAGVLAPVVGGIAAVSCQEKPTTTAEDAEYAEGMKVFFSAGDADGGGSGSFQASAIREGEVGVGLARAELSAGGMPL